MTIDYHHQGLMNGDLPLLSQALYFYHLGLEFLCTAKDAVVSGTHTLRMALYNNCGHVCSFLGDGQGVLKCREGLHAELEKATSECGTGTFFQQSLTQWSL